MKCMKRSRENRKCRFQRVNSRYVSKVTDGIPQKSLQHLITFFMCKGGLISEIRVIWHILLKKNLRFSHFYFMMGFQKYERN